MKKVAVHPELYGIITVGGALIFGASMALGIGCLCSGLYGAYSPQDIVTAWGAGLVSFPVSAGCWWLILNMFFTSDR